jgi:hypothetical protein
MTQKKIKKGTNAKLLHIIFQENAGIDILTTETRLQRFTVK